MRCANDDGRLDRAFAALADPTRRAAVERLRLGPRRAGELAHELGSSPAGISRHLRVLRESGLVAEEVSEQDARVRVYCLQREPFEALRSWVQDVESFWNEQLASFKAYAESSGAAPTSGPANLPDEATDSGPQKTTSRHKSGRPKPRRRVNH